MTHPRSKIAAFFRPPLAACTRMALLLLILVGIIVCPWFYQTAASQPVPPSLTPTPNTEKFELINFQAGRTDNASWCAWVTDNAQFHITAPVAGDYLLTITTQDTTYPIVMRVYQACALTFDLQPDRPFESATLQIGSIHSPTAADIPVNEADYQSPAIWPAAPYATLFAWPMQGGIGVWDQIFEPDLNATLIPLAETKNGEFNLRTCVKRLPAGSITTPTTAVGRQNLPETATRTPTVVLPTASRTPTSTLTSTPLPPTATHTSTYTYTPLPTTTFTHTPFPTATFTHTPLPTTVFTQTPLSTFTFTPTNTFTASPPPPTPTLTDTPTSTFTSTITDTPTSTFTSTVTDTPTSTFTSTVTDTPTSTFTPALTFTPLTPHP